MCKKNIESPKKKSCGRLTNPTCLGAVVLAHPDCALSLIVNLECHCSIYVFMFIRCFSSFLMCFLLQTLDCGCIFT